VRVGSNQELRYALGRATPFPGFDRSTISPHRAAFDVVVTAAIFEELIKKARWRMLQLTVCYSLRPAAAKIRLVISLGCETRERWPASNSTVVAFIRAARNRSSSGDMV
jgi:DNA polymerase III epsilon subunit-like protein